MEKTSPFGTQRDSRSGEFGSWRTITEIYLRQGKRGLTLGSKEKHDLYYYAYWKDVTVGIWKSAQKNTSIGLLLDEPKVWDKWLIETNLVDDLQDLGRFRPSFVPYRFYREVVGKNTLSKKEVNQLKFDCRTMVLSGTAIKNAHPLFEEAFAAIAMHERYGIVSYPTVASMPNKTYEAFRIINQTYNQATEQKRNLSELQQQARMAAGRR